MKRSELVQAKINKEQIPCLLEKCSNPDSGDCNCGYGTVINCEDCVCNGGGLDPRLEIINAQEK